MKFTRKAVSILLGLIALFFVGAVMGSYIPNISVYAAVAAGAVAVLIVGLWFYYGHEKEDVEEENSHQ